MAQGSAFKETNFISHAFSIPTMKSVNGCVTPILDTIMSIPGVLEAEVELGRLYAHVKVDHTQVTPHDICGAIQNMGHSARYLGEIQPENTPLHSRVRPA